MVSWLLLVLWSMNVFEHVRGQFYICPREDGLFFSTSLDCRTYYQCLNRILWTGICFPWQQFDVHTLRCRRVFEVDCNPEYAGIWRPVFGEIGGLEQGGVGGVEEQIIQEEIINEEIGNRPLREEGEIINTEEEAQQEQEEIAEAEAEGLRQEEVNSLSENEGETEPEEEVLVEEPDTKQEQIYDNEETAISKNDNENLSENEEESNNEAIKMAKIRNRRASEWFSKIKRAIQDNNWMAKIAEEASSADDITKQSNQDGTDCRATPSTDQPHTSVTDTAVTDTAVTDTSVTDTSVTDTSVTDTKQETTSESYWYWCGSGRFVFVQNPEQGEEICLQLQDPEFINEEGGQGQGGGVGAGHTFLGSDMFT